ncbi:MAG: hypothetical protein ACT4OU_06970 [Hyphomicrobium sp.]
MSSHFETYVNNLNRRRMVDFIDRYGAELQRQMARQSLVDTANVGSAYDPIYLDAKPTSPR